jgi:hypothetical protein
VNTVGESKEKEKYWLDRDEFAKEFDEVPLENPDLTKNQEESMAKCKECGEPLSRKVDACPKCGVAGGPETITDLPRANLRKAHKQLKEEIKEIRKQEKLKE